MKNILLVFVLIVVFLSVILNADTLGTVCPQPNQFDLLQTGTHVFQKLQGREICTLVTLNFEAPSSDQVQITASLYELPIFSSGNIIKVFVKAGHQIHPNNTFALSILSNSVTAWTKIQVNYIASARPDILVGNFLVDSFRSSVCFEKEENNDSSVLIASSGVISNWKTGFQNGKPIVFLSGFQSTSNIQDLQITTVSLNSSGIIEVEIGGLNAFSLEIIQISYIIVRSDFPYQHGFELQNPEYSLLIAHKILDSKLSSQLWGIDRGLLFCEGTDCIEQCIDEQTCTKLKGNQRNDSCIICDKGYQWNGNSCQFICQKNQVWNGFVCECNKNSIKFKNQCFQCPLNSSPDPKQENCICNKGFIWSDWKKACVGYSCPDNSQPVVTEKEIQCKCVKGFYLKSQSKQCKTIPSCPQNAFFDVNLQRCLCKIGQYHQKLNLCINCQTGQSFNEQLKKCVCLPQYIATASGCKKCPANSVINPQKQICQCKEGYFMDYNSNKTGECVAKNPCPKNSKWNSLKYLCQCVNPNQYLIGQQCRTCNQNQTWNSFLRKCECKQSYYLIGTGKCGKCPQDQTYNGTHCVCNLGLYRENGECKSCHPTCGTCQGPSNNQCLTCSDVTYNFRKGQCVKDSKCPPGLYFKGSACYPCSTYCAQCSSQVQCNNCIEGFQIQKLTYGQVTASFCVEKCGDGKRFQLDCDDGNNNNGDGCSADCHVESGWACSGGSSLRPSVCVHNVAQKVQVQLTGQVHLYGKIVQGVRLSSIPSALTQNDCAQCYNLLWVRVIRSPLTPGIRINYLPKSKYQFLVEFEFHGTFSIPSFTIAVQINPDYAKYFSRRDMMQIQIRTIDPSVLAIKDNEKILSIDDIHSGSNSLPVSQEMVQEIFK